MKNTHKITLLFLFLGLAFITKGQTILAGKIGNLTLDSTGNPYLITDNLTILKEKTVTIKEGAVLLFKPFTGLIVDGSLVVHGTLVSPVVFSSANDNAYTKDTQQLPNPFDWNGILVSEKADVINMSNFLLTYSVYGIKSQKKTFSIENGTFKQNGQFNFTIEDQVEKVIDGIPYTYGVKNNSNVRKIIPYIFGVTGLSTGIVSIISLTQYSQRSKEYETEIDQFKIKGIKKQGRKELTKSVIFGSVSVVTLSSSMILIIRNKKRINDKRISLRPSFSKESLGANLSIRF